MRVHCRAEVRVVLQNVEEEPRSALRLPFERRISNCKVLKLILEILVKQVNTDAKRDLDTSPRCSKRRQRTRDDGGVVLMPGMKMVHVSCESDLR